MNPSAPTSADYYDPLVGGDALPADVDAPLDTAVRPETKSVITGHNGADVDAETVRIAGCLADDNFPSDFEWGVLDTVVEWDSYNAKMVSTLRSMLSLARTRLRSAGAERDAAQFYNREFVKNMTAEYARLREALEEVASMAFDLEPDHPIRATVRAALKETTDG